MVSLLLCWEGDAVSDFLGSVALVAAESTASCSCKFICSVIEINVTSLSTEMRV